MSANFFDGNNLKPFRFWCQKVLPLVYDDSLSYYELLCKVVDYINKLIDDETELVEAYAKLQEYVNNYFDNLDVSEEINNKLDSMAEDGSLTELIKNYLEPYIDEQNSRIDNIYNYTSNAITNQNAEIDSIRAAVGSPLVASSVSQMTDQNKIYVYTGNETGYTSGHWYYWNGSAWADGGIYNSSALETDKTLSVENMAADAAATGVVKLKTDLINISGGSSVNSIILWEQGAISTRNGQNAVNNERVRSKTWIPTNATIVSVPSNRGFYILAYSLQNTYIGAYKSDGSFVADGTENGYNWFDMRTIYAVHPGYRLRLSVYSRDSTPVQVSETPNWILRNLFTDLVLNDNVLNLSPANNINDRSLWESGAIAYANGQTITSTERIRTKAYLPTNTAYLTVPETRGYFIYAYNISGAYIGAYNTDGIFVTDGSESLFTSFNICYLTEKYPGYRFKVCVVPRNNIPVAVNESGNFEITNILSLVTPRKIRVMQYNIGGYNMGHDGGMPENLTSTKIKNYKNFYSDQEADIVMLLENRDYINAGNTIQSKQTLYDPIYNNSSYTERDTIIFSNFKINNTRFSYCHTSGDPSAWVIYGDIQLGKKTIGIATGVLNVTSNLEQKQRALNKLLNQLMSKYDNVIIGLDTNALSETEANGIIAYMGSYDYSAANGTYKGFIDSYNPASSMYHAIDSVFVKGNLKIINYFAPDVLADLYSDHMPFIADIALTD